MGVVAEIAGLVQGAGRLWLRRFPVIGAWFCLGWAGREIGLQAAVLFGANLVPAMICFVASMLVWVICLVMMVHALAGDLISFQRAADDPSVPRIQRLSRRTVLLEAVIPFLAVYAVWGLTEDQIQRAFDSNMAFYNMDIEHFSITFAAWTLYLWIAVGCWIAQWLLGLALRGHGGLPGALAMTSLRGTAILTAFIGLDSLVANGLTWLWGRQVWAWGRTAWEGFLAWLPDWRLPFDFTLPEAIAAVFSGIWDYLVPGFIEAVLLPLIWLALTAMVVGWHDFTHGVAQGRLASMVTSQAERVRQSRLGQGLTAARAASPLGLLRFWVWEQLEDILPAVQALRLIIRSGLAFLGAYLLLGAAARALEIWIYDGLLWVIGPNSFADTNIYISLLGMLAGLVSWTVAACVYVAAFDRAMVGAVAHAEALNATAAPRTPPAGSGNAPLPMDPPQGLPAGPPRWQ